MNLVEAIQNWVMKPTGNVTAALDSGTDTVTLASGLWYVWATQTFKLSVQAASGAIGATPTVWPANTPVPIYVGETSVVAHITRLATDGNYYFNRATHSE